MTQTLHERRGLEFGRAQDAGSGSDGGQNRGGDAANVMQWHDVERYIGPHQLQRVGEGHAVCTQGAQPQRNHLVEQ